MRRVPLRRSSTGDPPFAEFVVALPARIRLGSWDDVDGLGWYGLFAGHRPIVERTLDAQRLGRALVLVADVDGFPAGQLFLELHAGARRRTGAIWALRVFPLLQGRGIGTRLLDAAESLLRARGYERSELGVAKDNPGARRLYERLGYRVVREEWARPAPGSAEEGVIAPFPQWVLSKELRPLARQRRWARVVAARARASRREAWDAARDPLDGG